MQHNSKAKGNRIKKSAIKALLTLLRLRPLKTPLAAAQQVSVDRKKFITAC